MPSPFPGMDPYLESADLWPEVHHRLITAIAIELAAYVRPKYRVAIEKRIYLSSAESSLLVGIPDVSISTKAVSTTPQPSSTTTTIQTHPIQVMLPMPEEVQEGYLEIREVGTGTVVTAIEVLSPKNKRPGEGLEAYERKQRQVLASMTHFIEIDLLKEGRSALGMERNPSTDYHILVSRSHCRPIADLYAFNLPDTIPAIPIPLRPEDAEPVIDLQKLLEQIYEQANFESAIDYQRSPSVPCNQETLD